MKKRIMILSLLVMIVAITSVTFAYWASHVVAPDQKQSSAVIQLGSGADATATLSLNSTNDLGSNGLVPKDANIEGSRHTVTFSVTFKWTETTSGIANGAKANVYYRLSNFQFTNSGKTITSAQMSTILGLFTINGETQTVAPNQTFNYSALSQEMTLGSAEDTKVFTVSLTFKSMPASSEIRELMIGGNISFNISGVLTLI